MTKSELKKKMLEFLETKDPDNEDEWYGTDRLFYTDILSEFCKTINIELGEVDNE